MFRFLKVMCVISAAFIGAGTLVAQAQQPELPKPSKEHEFLKKFVGEWEGETELFLEPGKPPVKNKGTMTAHMLGDFWAIVVVKGEAFGQSYTGQATFGFDSQKKKKYIGTWTDSMTDFLWKYEGVVEGDKLVLDSEGPNPADAEKMMKARDTWEFKGKDLLILTGEMEGPDGKLVMGMRVACKRKK